MTSDTGRRALVVLAHAEVLVVNPEIARLGGPEIDQYRRFCEGRGVDVAVRVANPAFWDSFAVRVLGSRAHTRRDCTADCKRLANTRELAALWRELAQLNWREPVPMTSVRRDQSVARALSIASRGLARRAVGVLRGAGAITL